MILLRAFERVFLENIFCEKKDEEEENSGKTNGERKTFHDNIFKFIAVQFN